MTKLRLLAPIITAIVIVVLSLGWFRSCDRFEELKDEAYQAQNGARKVEEVQNAVISSLRDSVKAIRTLRSEDSVKHLRVSDSLKTRDKKITGQLVSIRKKMQPIIDTSAIVKQYVHMNDSLLAVKEARILEEQRNNLVQYKSFTSEIVHLHGQIDAEKLKTEAWRTSAEQSEKKVAKSDRKRKFWRTAAFVMAGIAGVLGVSQ